MNKEDFLNSFDSNLITERDLSNSNEPYVIHHISDEAGVSGYAIVSVTEGTLLLPYTNVLVKEEYEQFNLEDARLIDKDDLLAILGEMESQVKNFKKMFLSTKIGVGDLNATCTKDCDLSFIPIGTEIQLVREDIKDGFDKIISIDAYYDSKLIGVAFTMEDYENLEKEEELLRIIFPKDGFKVTKEVIDYDRNFEGSQVNLILK